MARRVSLKAKRHHGDRIRRVHLLWRENGKLMGVKSLILNNSRGRQHCAAALLIAEQQRWARLQRRRFCAVHLDR